MQNALDDTSFQDMFLRFFCLQNAPICHTENTACSQKEWEEAENLARGWNTVRAFGTHGKMEAFGNRKGHFSTSEQSCTLLLEELRTSTLLDAS